MRSHSTLSPEEKNRMNHEASARERGQSISSPTVGWEISDEMVNAAAREMWNDRDARHAGSWDERDPREVCVIQTKATAKAALIAALAANNQEAWVAALLNSPSPEQALAATLAVDGGVAHAINEWADLGSNSLQWLKNIRDGISTADEALAEMSSNYERVLAIGRAAQAAQPASPLRPTEEQIDAALNAWFKSPPSETDQGLERSMKAALIAADALRPPTSPLRGREDKDGADDLEHLDGMLDERSRES